MTHTTARALGGILCWSLMEYDSYSCHHSPKDNVSTLGFEIRRSSANYIARSGVTIRFGLKRKPPPPRNYSAIGNNLACHVHRIWLFDTVKQFIQATG